MYMIKEKIEDERRKLLKTIEDENNNFSSKKVLKHSRNIDRLVLKYIIKRNRNINKN